MMVWMLRELWAAAGGPMQIAASAMRTGRLSASAVEWTTTVSMPIRRQVRMMRRAISPRLAIRIRLNIGVPKRVAGRAGRAGSADQEEHGSVLDGLAVLDADLLDRALHPALGLDLVEDLHGLDQAD